MAQNPSSQWFWNDWVLDPALRMCSMAAQGFWMQMLAIAASATPRGYVRVGDKPCTIADLARITGQDLRSVRNWVGELQQNGVLSVAEFPRTPENSGEFGGERVATGYISRRLVREQNEEIRQISARARATLDSDSDSIFPLTPKGGIDKINKPGRKTKPPRRPVHNHNGVTEHHAIYGPLRDPVEIAKERGLRK